MQRSARARWLANLLASQARLVRPGLQTHDAIAFSLSLMRRCRPRSGARQKRLRVDDVKNTFAFSDKPAVAAAAAEMRCRRKGARTSGKPMRSRVARALHRLALSASPETKRRSSSSSSSSWLSICLRARRRRQVAQVAAARFCPNARVSRKRFAYKYGRARARPLALRRRRALA